MVLVLAAVLTCAVLAFVLWPVLRPGTRPSGAGDAPETALYVGQLAQIERDIEEGRLMADEAESTKREVTRRMLAASRRGERRPDLASGGLNDTRRIAVILVAVAVPLVALTLYLSRGEPDAPGAPLADRAQELAAAGIPSAEERALVEKLAAEMEKNPGNPQGWALLGGAYVRMQRYGDAVDAYARALEVKGPDAELLSALGEALVLRSDGQMSDESRFAFQSALEIEPKDARARFFLALDKAQAGDLNGAVEGWAALLEDTPENAPWREAVEAQIERAGREMMSSLGTQTTPAPAGEAGGALPALDPETAAQAQAMSPEDRAAMIEGMVGRLADRLKNNPDDLAGWLRLARSYAVLGKTKDASNALDTAAAHFADDFAALAEITQARGALGLGTPVSP